MEDVRAFGLISTELPLLLVQEGGLMHPLSFLREKASKILLKSCMFLMVAMAGVVMGQLSPV